MLTDLNSNISLFFISYVLFTLCYSADERFDATFHTNVLVNYSGSCQYIPPGRAQRASVCFKSMCSFELVQAVFIHE